MRLEIDSGRELGQAWIVDLRGLYNTVARSARCCAGRSEVRRVQDIEELAANFEVERVMYLELLEQREIQKRMDQFSDIQIWANGGQRKAGVKSESRSRTQGIAARQCSCGYLRDSLCVCIASIE